MVIYSIILVFAGVVRYLYCYGMGFWVFFPTKLTCVDYHRSRKQAKHACAVRYGSLKVMCSVVVVVVRVFIKFILEVVCVCGMNTDYGAVTSTRVV